MSTAEQPVISLDVKRSTNKPSSGQPSYVARTGLCILEELTYEKDRKANLRKVIACLKDDPRVKDLVELDLKSVSLSSPKFFITNRESKPDFTIQAPISASVHSHALQISPPLQFTVQIPRRLQAPKGANADSVPSEEYWVVWDGVVVVVLWKCEDSPHPFGALGGVAVIKLLDEIVKKSDNAVTAQPCGPNCDYLFAHCDIQVVATDEQEDGREFKEAGRWRVSLEIGHEHAAPDAAASSVYRIIGLASRLFAHMRSDGKAISDIEESAREDLDELLEIYHTTTLIGSLVSPKSWKARWELRGWRRNAKRLIARLWLALSALEARRHDWANNKFSYDRAANSLGRNLIFRHEYDDEVNYISAVDVSSIESSVAYAASHLDTQSLVKTTAIAAIVGGIMGAVITGALQLASSPTTSSPSSPPATATHPAQHPR